MESNHRSFRIISCGPLTVVEIPLTKAEIDKCLNLGRERTELDEKKLGWRYRHHGKPSAQAHGVGFTGEEAFEKWLQRKGLKPDRDYNRADSFVERLEDIQQDFTIWGKTVGVKTAENPSLQVATRFSTFLYPAKGTPGEARRVLDYPEFLVQTVADIPGTRCWLCGFVDRDTITKSPIGTVGNKPAHRISISQYRPVDQLLEVLSSSSRRNYEF